VYRCSQVTRQSRFISQRFSQDLPCFFLHRSPTVRGADPDPLFGLIVKISPSAGVECRRLPISGQE
jgi:hypothetical protein